MKYVAIISPNAVRDAQASPRKDPSPLDDDWFDVEGAAIYLGVFSGTPSTARTAAAQFGNVDEDNIELIGPFTDES